MGVGLLGKKLTIIVARHHRIVNFDRCYDFDAWS